MAAGALPISPLKPESACFAGYAIIGYYFLLLFFSHQSKRDFSGSKKSSLKKIDSSFCTFCFITWLELFWELLSFFFAIIFLNAPQTILDATSDLVEAAWVEGCSEVSSNRIGSTELTLLYTLTVACTADSSAVSLVITNSLNLRLRGKLNQDYFRNLATVGLCFHKFVLPNHL